MLHYHLNQRDDTELWRYLKNMEVPDTLRDRIDSFAQGAQAWQAAGEVFRVDSWVQVMLGQRLEPRHWHPIGALMREGRLRQTLADTAQTVARTISGMPSHQAFLDGYCAEGQGHERVE